MFGDFITFIYISPDLKKKRKRMQRKHENMCNVKNMRHATNYCEAQETNMEIL